MGRSSEPAVLRRLANSVAKKPAHTSRGEEHAPRPSGPPCRSTTASAIASRSTGATACRTPYCATWRGGPDQQDRNHRRRQRAALTRGAVRKSQGGSTKKLFRAS